ncbi:Uncharacterized protein FWK35_00030959 [Aphis craccivora]|uniref:Uncharacterized protein n=1 Tax=Aphis craccivora TaxID=307492 RepID=A0A6G0Z4M1_APHCR|nr:Uncharacterized protein FWK35_00030959 [Aphis craccivora]
MNRVPLPALKRDSVILQQGLVYSSLVDSFKFIQTFSGLAQKMLIHHHSHQVQFSHNFHVGGNGKVILERCNRVFSKTNGLGEGKLQNINNIRNGTLSNINIEKYTIDIKYAHITSVNAENILASIYASFYKLLMSSLAMRIDILLQTLVVKN